MVKVAALLCAEFLLSGCAASPLVTNDLSTALAIAQAQGDIEGVVCFSFLLERVSIPPAPLIQPVGLVSAFEAAHVAVGVAQAGVSAGDKLAAEEACGPYALNVMGGMAWLAKTLGAAIPIP